MSQALRIAFGYTRISVVDEGDDSKSLDAQATKIRQYCAFRDLKLMDIFSDQAVSGGVRLEQRPRGGELMRQLRHQDARGCHLVFARLDRAFRNALDSLTTLAELERLGITVHFADLGVDLSRPEGQLIVMVLSAVAEWERKRIAERTREVLLERKRQGLCYGGIPLGYRRVEPGSELIEEDPAGMATLGRIQELREQQVSMTKMQRILEDEGRATQLGRRSWSRSSIDAALKRLRADQSLVLAARRHLRDERARAAGFLEVEETEAAEV